MNCLANVSAGIDWWPSEVPGKGLARQKRQGVHSKVPDRNAVGLNETPQSSF